MTALTIAQTAADEIGIDRPASLVGSTDNNARQMLALLNREGRELVRRYPWAALIREYVVTVTSGTSKYAVASDFSSLVDETMWDVTNRWPLIGPLSSDEWETLKRGIIVSTPRRVWRLVGKTDGVYSAGATPFYVEIMPTPDNSTDQFSYEYWSSGFARQNSDAALSVFDNDSDNPVLPEELFTLGLIWRWKRAKGLDYAQEFETYDRAVNIAISQDKSARPIDLTRPMLIGPRLLDWQNIPETGFGS